MRLRSFIAILILGTGIAGADTLTVIGRLSLPHCTNVFVSGHICYATDSYGLEAVDITDPTNPTLLGRCPLPDTGQAVTVRDSIAYVSDADSGLAIVNVARPESLSLLSRWRQYEGYAYEAGVYGDTAYLANGYSYDYRPPYQGGIFALDVSNPSNPRFGRYYSSAVTNPYPFNSCFVKYTSVVCESGHVYVAAWGQVGNRDLMIPFGVLELANYPVISINDIPGAFFSNHKMSMRYPFAYIIRSSDCFTIVRFRTPSDPDTVFEHNLGGRDGRGVWAESARVYVTIDSTVELLDVSDPCTLTVMAACSLDNDAYGIQSSDPYVYVANGPYLTILQHSPSGVEERSQGPRVKDQGVTVNPNPFTFFAKVPGHSSDRFTLYDISGRLLGTYGGDRIGEGLAPGVYFLKAKGVSSPPIRVVKVR